MKTNKKKRLTIIGIFVLVFLISVSSLFFPRALSEKQISALREDYPVIAGYPSHLEFKEPDITEIYNLSDVILLVKVIEELPDYSVDLIENSNSPEGKMAEKQNGKGIVSKVVYKQYKVSIIDILQKNNTEDITLAEEKEIDIFYSSEFLDYMPSLKAGMRIIIPVLKGTELHEGKYSITKYGLYYTTEDDFILSAFEEENSFTFTGKSIDYFKDYLKQNYSIN